MDEEWMWSDAWVLLSIGGADASTGSTLVEVIGVADYRNHAILTEPEFTQAVGRLLAAGLVGVDIAADRYWLRDAGRVVSQHGGRGGSFEGVEAALRELGRPTTLGWALPADMFDSAVEAYQEGFSKL
ncbi:hypothetical protein [Dactylosporangium sp. NPDC048998]|uniref:hypothetical protein n=1 Tax=Dactylosporangium sp. NPDC048998 TaxID=3363976 RepID=UPI00371FABE6